MTSNRLACALLLLIAIAGVAVAGYLTSVHYASVPLVCSSSGVVNCEQVLHSRYSELAGVPWSVVGIVWFAASGALAVVALLRREEPEALHVAQAIWSLLGLAVVVYLIAVEVVAIRHICIWCTSLHALVLLTLLLVLVRQPDLVEDELA